MNRRNFLKAIPIAGSSLLVNQGSESLPTTPDQEALGAVREHTIRSFTSFLNLKLDYGEIDENEFKSGIAEFQSKVKSCDDVKLLKYMELTNDEMCHHMRTDEYRIRKGTQPQFRKYPKSY